PDRFRIQRAGVQLFSPPRMTARIDEQIKAMNRAGVDQAALHVGVWLDWVDLKAARLINDKIAEITAQYPDRLIPLAHAPPLESEGQRELKRAVLELGCKGVGVNTHVGGILLDNERLHPFYKTVSDLDIPILVHPAAEIPLAHPHGMEQFNLTRNLGRAFDTTINIARLMLDEANLTQQLKDIRHGLLSGDLSMHLRLLQARDSTADVGIDTDVTGTEGEKNLASVVIANSRRVQESLRTLEELAKKFCISGARVRKIEEKALQRLRLALGEWKNQRSIGALEDGPWIFQFQWPHPSGQDSA
ncbi:MAG: amidohydrolase family protein, partial [Acidobacteria bacterium]|nr:amidohydrolase family protein [Acidobacteriota bacterium]